MENTDHVRERFEALERQTEQLKHETQSTYLHGRAATALVAGNRLRRDGP
jgi:hypothetical protein